MKTDIQIVQEAKLKPIKDVAASIGIQEDDLELYGKYKAKLSDELMERTKDNPNGKLILASENRVYKLIYRRVEILRGRVFDKPCIIGKNTG